VSPLRVTPCHTDEPSPNFTSPISTAFGATQSAYKDLGYFVLDIGMQRSDG
jgi:hypothetical protein